MKPHTLKEVYQSIEKIGRIVDRRERSQEIVKEMKSTLESVDLKGKKIYCEEWMDPPMVSGNWIPGLVKSIGGIISLMVAEAESSI